MEGRAAYQFQNTSGQGWTVCFGVDPGYDITSARANGAEISPVRTGYEESNMALWEIALPADGAVELVLEYGGFPRDWNIAETTQGAPEISGAYLCLENQNLMPYLLNVLPEGQGYPTTVELTLPGSMTVIPFGTSEAEVVETTATAPPPGAMRMTALAASSTPGTTSGRTSRPAASPSSSTMAGSIRR